MNREPDFSWVFEQDPSWVPGFIEPVVGIIAATVILYAVIEPWLTGASRG